MNKPWVNRKSGPFKMILSYEKHVPLYYRMDGRLITEICCGERYAHISPGLIFNDELYVGSYLDNWHGGPSGSLNDMVKWLENAKFPEWEYKMWMIK